MYRTEQKILDRTQLLRKLTAWRLKQKSIVFTNGCFDILHLGHISYLEQARNLGDVLIIGVNTDNSVCRLKGPSRPLVDQHARSRVLAALEFVDAVVLFDEDTPYELIKMVQPDILIKGSDYQPEDIVGYDVVSQKGGQVATIPLMEGYSTTGLVVKIKQLP